MERVYKKNWRSNIEKIMMMTYLFANSTAIKYANKIFRKIDIDLNTLHKNFEVWVSSFFSASFLPISDILE